MRRNETKPNVVKDLEARGGEGDSCTKITNKISHQNVVFGCTTVLKHAKFHFFSRIQVPLRAEILIKAWFSIGIGRRGHDDGGGGYRASVKHIVL